MRSAVLLRQKGRKTEGRKKKERLDRKRNNTAQRGPRESNNEEESPGGGSQQNAADTNIMEIAMQMIIITNIPACVFLFLRAGRCTKKKAAAERPAVVPGSSECPAAQREPSRGLRCSRFGSSETGDSQQLLWQQHSAAGLSCCCSLAFFAGVVDVLKSTRVVMSANG